MWWKDGPIPMYLSMWYAPGMGRGAARAYIETIFLPISPNLEQAEDDAPVAGIEHTRTSAPTPSVDSEPTDSEPSRMAASDTMGDTPQGSLDQPAPLRCGTHATQNQLPLRYHNFALLVSWMHGLVCAFVSI